MLVLRLDNLPIINIQTHGHNGIVLTARTGAPCIVLSAILLLVLVHHLHVLRPRLWIIMVKADRYSHARLHLLPTWHLMLWLNITIALLMH
jgi:hypothetical protein